MQQLSPIVITDLFPGILDQLLKLLSELSAADWELPTACSSWSVKDVALHLLGDDVGILSRKRDRFSLTDDVGSWEELVDFVDELNALWVKATRRVSPRLLLDLLQFTGEQVCVFFRSLDPYVIGGPVSWAGPDPAPVWLDLSREYTERWLHQQHIRDAVGRPGLKQRRYFAPVLDAFVRALPHTYRGVVAPDGTVLALTISGASGGRWFLLRERGVWKLYLGASEAPDAELVVDQDVAWRVFTRGLAKDEARSQVTVLGDASLGLRVLDMVSIIA